MFKKRKADGVIINTSEEEYDKYVLRKNAVKAMVNTKDKLKETQQSLATLKDEMQEIREMLAKVMQCQN